MPSFRIGAASNIGGRPNNEDAFFVAVRDDRTGGIAPTVPFDLVLAVADGMGGGAFGEDASAIVVMRLKSIFVDGNYARWLVERGMALAEPMTLLKDIAEALNREIVEAANLKGVSTMGSTLDLVAVRGNTAYYAHVGDSRVWHLSPREAAARQVTRDQTVAAEARRHGIPADEILDPHRVTSMLGAFPTVDVEVGQFEVRASDVIILATDGVNRLMPRDFFYHLGRNEKDLNKIAEVMVAEAVQRRGPKADNATMVVAAVESEGLLSVAHGTPATREDLSAKRAGEYSRSSDEDYAPSVSEDLTPTAIIKRFASNMPKRPATFWEWLKDPRVFIPLGAGLFLSLFLVLVLALTFPGCGKKDGKQQTKAAATAPAQKDGKQQAAAAATAPAQKDGKQQAAAAATAPAQGDGKAAASDSGASGK